jgi:hypothetical protein
LLEPFREVADEIVIGADSRVDDQTLVQYAAVADRVFRVEFAFLERHLAWLHAQCSSDWILRIDSDEVASPSIVGALGELISNRYVRQYWFPRRWLFGEPGRWLNEPPWWPDYQLRLYRNDCFLSFAGILHSSAVSQPPSGYTELPLYHLDLLVNGYESRQRKAAVYEELRRNLGAPGGGAMNERYYLPELTPSVELSHVPADDLREVERVLAAPDLHSAVNVPDVPLVTLAESDRWLEGRPFDPAIHRGEIVALESAIRMRVGERRVVHFRVTNRGSESWPWQNPDLDVGRQVRLSYHWLEEDGAIHDYDGEQTWLPCRLGPGEATVVPLMVHAPGEARSFVLEVDLVHECWFGCSVRVPVDVLAALGPCPR